ncbi:MAG: S8/S53 family peptidase [Hyphomicrobiales bacterium]
MRVLYTLLLIVFFDIALGADLEKKYFIGFTDKDNTPFTVEEPLAYLSQKSIDRREKYSIPIIKQDLPVDPNYIRRVVGMGAKILNQTKWMNGITVIANEDIIPSIEQLSFVREVKYIGDIEERNETVDRKFGEADPENKIIPLKSDINYGSGFTQINMIKGDVLHEQGYRGEDMLVAVIDGGFKDLYLTRVLRALIDENRIIATQDFVYPKNTNVFSKSTHGTRVLSTMAAYFPGEFVGTAPKAKYVLLRSEDVGSETLIEEYNWVSAAEYADSIGCDLVNSSLGYVDFDKSIWNHTYSSMTSDQNVISIGATIAESKGMMIVNSNGNEGNEVLYRNLSAPADALNIIAVGAVDNEGEYSSLSSLGYTYDGRVNPGICTVGENAIIALRENVFGGNGTSYSSPIAAGVITCLMQKYKYVPLDKIREAIYRSSHKYSDPDAQYGYGIPDFSKVQEILTKESKEVSYNIYPNPCHNRLIISCKEIQYEPSHIKIYNIEGELIFERVDFIEKGGMVLDGVISSISKGIYFIKIESMGKLSMEKIVIL